MINIISGASVVLSLSADEYILVDGYGMAVIAGSNSPMSLTGPGKIGPFGTSKSIVISSSSDSFTYSVANAKIDPADTKNAYRFDGSFAGVKGDGPANVLPATARGDTLIKKYGVTAFDICRAPGVGNTMLIGVTDLTHVVSGDRPRASTFTRRLTLGATGTSEIRFIQMNAFDPDPIDKAFSIDVYLESHPSEYLGTGLTPNIEISISNSATTSIGSNFSRWSFSAINLRQGWNTLKIRQADTVDAVNSSGNLPYGCLHPSDVGTGFDWALGGARFVSLRFLNMQNQIVTLDQIRRPARAKSVLVIGFDATGGSNTDDVFLNKVAPLFAKYDIRSYCTYTQIYEMLFAGGQSWKRMARLYNEFGWDVINHTWSHGGTAVGRNVPVTLAGVADLVTVNFGGAHGIIVGTAFKANISGASIAAFNGVWTMTATSTTAATYTATGAGTATPTGTIQLRTFLSEVFNADTSENRALWGHEVADVSRSMRASGFARGASFLAYPNNSVPELSVLQAGCAAAGVVVGRGVRGGYTSVNEFGIDNPLNAGSYAMESQSGLATTTTTLEQKVLGAISRGDHIQIFGHYILDDNDPANAAYAPTLTPANEYPPSYLGSAITPTQPGANPNPPAAGISGTGGWWYYSQLERLITGTVGPAILRGDLLVMSPSEYKAYMGL